MACLGMNTLLLQTELNADARLREMRVHDSAEALLTLINDILDVSRARTRKFFSRLSIPIWSRWSKPPSVCSGQRRAKKRIALQLAIPENPVFAEDDPTRLRQVLLNLVGNAIEFTEQGSVSVTVAPRPSRRKDAARLRFRSPTPASACPKASPESPL